MKPETQGWVAKAEGDYAVAVRELGTAAPVFDAVCFHAQQCAEKYLKAFSVRIAENVRSILRAKLGCP